MLNIITSNELYWISKYFMCERLTKTDGDNLDPLLTEFKKDYLEEILNSGESMDSVYKIKSGFLKRSSRIHQSYKSSSPLAKNSSESKINS